MLASDGEASIVVEATVAPDALGEITNSASVTSPDESDPEDNTSSVTTPVVAVANLGVTKTVTAGGTVAGGSVTWEIVVTNVGPADAVDALLLDALPESVTLEGLSGPDGTACDVVDALVLCDLGTMPVGSSLTFEVVGVVDPDWRGELENVVVVASATDDPDESDNLAVAGSDVVGGAALSVTKTAATDSVPQGGNVLYTITVAASGTSTARDVVVAEDLPDGARVLDANPEAGTYRDGAWDIGTMTPGTSVELELIVRLDDVGRAVNTVTVSSEGGEVDGRAQAAVTVRAPSSPIDTSPSLPGTGTDVRWWTMPLAIALIAAGALLLLVARERRRIVGR
jgi:uncharacterized repeat protein (TIGR01451 family)